MGKIINYKNESDKGIFSQIKLDSGERVLISITANEIKIFKLKFFGVIPVETIWKYPIDDFLENPLDILVEKVKNFNSIVHLQNELNNFVANLEKNKK